ncbi:MAG: ATP-binding protein [Coprobacillus sp.]|nr:ATP-binding protein [Coprobacillus sp.]MDY4146129.1 AAA family ATPase [Bacilli bacterium]
MLKKIKLKNYRSFGNLEADFTIGSGKAKKLVVIYGENGSGKSNFITSILFLKNTLNTLSFQERLNSMIETNEVEKYDEKTLKSLIKITKSNLSEEIKNNKMIDSDENMVLEFNYSYSNNKEALYRLEFDNDKIVYEQLSAQLEKNMVKIFEISEDKIYFNKHLFINDKYENEIKEKTLKYFGKHSFISIIFNERHLNNNKYINQNISNDFLNAIEELNNCSVWCKNVRHEEGFIYTSKIIFNLSNGNIPKDEKEELLKIEEALNIYFSSLYSDIKSVHYNIQEEDNKIKYSLCFDKLINGKIRSIPFSLESTGTNKLLNIFPYIYNCLNNETVFIDEIDSGIHDVLMSYLLVNLEKQIKGQLIITTHNTLLLQKIKTDYLYVINVDANGNKSLNCIKDFGRIQNNHNVTNRYINGIFGGIPQPGYMDLQEIMSTIDNRR